MSIARSRIHRRLVGLRAVVRSCCSGERSRARTHHTATGLVLSVDRPGATVTISHDAFPGFMDAMAMPFDLQGSARAVRADARRSRAVPSRGQEAAVVGRSARRRLGRAGRCRPAADAGRRRCWCRSASPMPDFELTDQQARAVACRRSRARSSPSPSSTRAVRCPTTARGWSRTSGRCAAVRRADGSRPGAADDQLRSEVRHAGRCWPRYAASQRAGGPGWHFLTGDAGEHRARLQRVRDSVLAGGRADHALAADGRDRSRRPPGGDGRRQGLHAAAARAIWSAPCSIA